jgi:hypothetical protein
VIYFIFNERANAVKIGTAREPDARLESLQVGSPDPLILLLEIPGGLKFEARLHARFQSLCIRGEWFRADPELMAEVERLRASPPPLSSEELFPKKRLRLSKPRFVCVCGRANWNPDGHCFDCGPIPHAERKQKKSHQC